MSSPPRVCPTTGCGQMPPRHPPPRLVLAPPPTSALSGAAAGSRGPEDSACGTAGTAARGAGGCCWVGRGPCTAREVPSPALRCTCERRTRGSYGNLCIPELRLLSRDRKTRIHDSQTQTELLSVAVRPCLAVKSPVHGCSALGLGQLRWHPHIPRDVEVSAVYRLTELLNSTVLLSQGPLHRQAPLVHWT